MRSNALLLALLTGGFGMLSVWLGPDASWDLRNYHLYVAHAALSGTLWTDIAPAQLQSFYNPAEDIPFYLLHRALNAHPALLDFLLAVPHTVAVWLVLLVAGHLTRLVSAPHRSTRRNGRDLLPSSLAATILGATGAAALPTLGTGMSDMPASCLVLASLRLVLIGSRPGLAGTVAGAAVGLKLTNAPYAIGLAAASLLTRRRSTPRFLLAGAAGVLLTAGPWWWCLWRHTGNPLFPYFNELFRSPWAPPKAMTDTRFLPGNLWQAALFPALWAFQASTASAELPVRDPRLLLGLIACLALALIGAIRRSKSEAPERGLLAFWLVAFAAWEARFGILRYAAVLELLSGIPIALLLVRIRQWGSRGEAAPPVAIALPLALLTACLMAFTVYPHWGRAPPGPLAADVRPPFRAGDLVLLLDPAPMAYVAAFSPPGVRFAGVNNNLIRPGGGTALDHAVVRAILQEPGPLWGIESPRDERGEADRALGFYGLERSRPCVALRSNLDANALRACRLMPRPASEAGDSRPPRGRG